MLRTVGSVGTVATLIALEFNTGIKFSDCARRMEQEGIKLVPEDLANSKAAILSSTEASKVVVGGNTYELASLIDRIAATAVDIIYLGARIFLGMGMTFVVAWYMPGGSLDFSCLNLSQKLVLAAGTHITALYAMMVPSAEMIILNGQTKGKQTMGIRKLKLDGTSWDWKTVALIHVAGHLQYATGMWGLGLCLFNDKRQCLHNMIAGNVVVYDS